MPRIDDSHGENLVDFYECPNCREVVFRALPSLATDIRCGCGFKGDYDRMSIIAILNRINKNQEVEQAKQERDYGGGMIEIIPPPPTKVPIPPPPIMKDNGVAAPPPIQRRIFD